MELTRAEDIHFVRYDGTIIVAPPVTRSQMREILVIDREPGETPLDAAARRGLQVEVFLRHAHWVKQDPVTGGILIDRATGAAVLAGTIAEAIAKLTAEEETAICQAFTCQHHGTNPIDGLAILKAISEIVQHNARQSPAPIAEVIAHHDEMTMILADVLKKAPDEIDVMKYRDTIDYVGVHFERLKSQKKFEAALHGRELKS